MKSFEHSTNQTRTVGLFLARSDLDRIEMHPHLGLSSNPKGTRVHKMVQELKGKKGVDNPYALAQHITGQSYATGKKL
jgi:hypothetical protein